VNITKAIRWAGAAALLARATGVLVQLLSVPLLIKIFGQERYGSFLVLISLFSWFSLANLGLANSLTTPLSAAIARNDLEASTRLTSSALALIFTAAACVAIPAALALPHIPWHRVVGADNPDPDLSEAATIGALLTAVGLLTSLGDRLLFAQQRSHASYLLLCLANVATLLGIASILLLQHPASMTLIAAIVLTPTIAAQAVGALIALAHNSIRFAWRAVDRSTAVSLLGTGTEFLAAQAVAILMWQTDNLVVAALFDSATVAEYATTFKLAALGTIAFGAIVAGLWPAVAAASASGRTNWIQTTTQLHAKRLMGLAFAAGSLVILLGPATVRFWTAGTIHPSFPLACAVAAYLPVYAWCLVYSQVLNGLGAVRVQVIYGGAAAVANLGLSILLGRTFGVSGVCWATTIAALIPAYAVTKTYRNIVHDQRTPHR